MKIGILLVGITCLLGTAVTHANSMGYDDKDFGCIAQPQAQKFIDDFGIDESSFGGLELCNSQIDTKKLFNDLQIIEGGQFDSNQSNLLIKGIVPADKYYPWMKSQTRGMERGNDVPYATAYNQMGYFTMQDGWANSSTLARVGTVIHEARHTAGYRHYPCTQGPYSGASLDGCDQNYQQAGSHAVEMEYYARVSVAGQNFHPVYKSMARLMAMGRTNFVFNSLPIRQRELVLALDGSTRTPVLFDSTHKIQREGTDFVGRLKRTSFGAALFNGFQAAALDIYEMTGFRPSNQDDYSYFKLLKTSTLGSLKDFEEFDQGSKRYVAVVNNGNQVATYNFPRGSWNRLTPLSFDFARSSTMLLTGERGYFMVAQDGQIHSLSPETQQVSALGKVWDSQVASVAAIDGKTLVLRADGSIYQRATDGSESLFDRGAYTEMVNVPVYDAFEVK